MNNFHVIIPARYDSSRLQGKPLKKIVGKTMIEHVYRRALSSKAQSVYIATDDGRIADEVERFGGQCVMTSKTHQSGTDRLQEAAQILGLDDDAVVVNVQGDEPMIPAAVINQVAFNLSSHQLASAATLGELIQNPADMFDANAVKVVCSKDSLALYFSRAPIPWDRESYENTVGDESEIINRVKINSVKINSSKVSRVKGIQFGAMRHIGIYAYRVSLLNQFVTWEEAPLEKIEKLEQLRILVNGQHIHVDQACETVPGGVDTEDDLQSVIAAIKSEKIKISD